MCCLWKVSTRNGDTPFSASISAIRAWCFDDAARRGRGRAGSQNRRGGSLISAAAAGRCAYTHPRAKLGRVERYGERLLRDPSGLEPARRASQSARSSESSNGSGDSGQHRQGAPQGRDGVQMVVAVEDASGIDARCQCQRPLLCSQTRRFGLTYAPFHLN